MENFLQNIWSRTAVQDSRIAVLQHSKTRISYKEVERQSNAFAALLKEAGCEEGDRLCYMTRKKETALFILLGIMKAGCVGVPVSPNASSERIHAVMLNSDSNWLFTDESAASYPDPLLIDTGEISLGWLGEWKNIPKAVSPEFISENVGQYMANPGRKKKTAAHTDFTFVLTDDKNQMEEMHLSASHIETCVSQLNAVSGSLKPQRIATFFPDGGCRLFREMFGTGKQRGYFHLLPSGLLDYPSQLFSLLSSLRINGLFFRAEDILKLTESAKNITAGCDGVKEVIIWGKRPPHPVLIDVKKLFTGSKIISRFSGKIQHKEMDKKRDKKSVISTGDFKHKSLEHWQRLFFGLAEESMFRQLGHADYIREIKTVYLNYWRKVEEKNMLAVHRQPIKISFNNDL